VSKNAVIRDGDKEIITSVTKVETTKYTWPEIMRRRRMTQHLT